MSRPAILKGFAVLVLLLLLRLVLILTRDRPLMVEPIATPFP